MAKSQIKLLLEKDTLLLKGIFFSIFRKKPILRSKYSSIKPNHAQQGLSLVEIAIVILIIGTLMLLSLSLVRNASLFQTAKGEAKKLAEKLVFARNTAMLSNEVVFFEFDLDKESYTAYRLISGGQGSNTKKAFLQTTKLSNSNSLLAIASAMGSKRSEGIVKLYFFPSGLGEEVAIYLGPKDDEEIKATILYSRYGGKAKVYTEEIELNLEDPDWEELDVIE